MGAVYKAEDVILKRPEVEQVQIHIVHGQRMVTQFFTGIEPKGISFLIELKMGKNNP